MIKSLGSYIKGLFFILALSFNSLYGGSITSEVESKEILKGESVILTITIIGENYEKLPAIPRIAGAEVIGSKRNTKGKLITIDGKAVMIQISVLMLEFKPTTDITIPTFQMTIDGVMQSTQPIDIKIVKSKPKEKADDLDFLIEIDANKKSVVVGEPLLVYVYFKQRKDVETKSIDYKAPEFKGFSSKRVNNDSYTQGEYTVNKLTYLLVAKDKGVIEIPPVSVKIETKVKKDSDGWLASKSAWIKINSLGLNIEVKNPLKRFDIAGVYQLKEGVESQKIERNRPVHLKFSLSGEGSLDDFDGIDFDISGVTVYADDPKVETKIVDGKLLSSYKTSYVFISEHDFEIPSKSIEVYNYHTKAIETLKTKAYKIAVEGSSTASSSPTIYTKNSVDLGSSNQTVLSRLREIDIKWKVPAYGMLILFFLLGGVTALILRAILSKLNLAQLFKSKKYSRITHKEALSILYPYMNDTPEVEKITRALYRQQQGEEVKIDQERLKSLLIYYREKEDILDSL